MKHTIRVLIPLLFVAAATGCLSSDDGAASDGDDPLGTTAQALSGVLQTPSAATAATCSPPHQVSAAPGEEGQWAMVRVGYTGSTAYVPHTLKFYLRGQSAANGTWCAGNVSFKVRVFYSSSATNPPNNPTDVASTTVPATAAPATQDRAIDINIRGATIPAFRYVYVAVQMVGNPATDSGYNCLAGCAPQSSGINWWSLEDDKPYDWVSLASVGIGNMDIGMRVEGYVAP